MKVNLIVYTTAQQIGLSDWLTLSDGNWAVTTDRKMWCTCMYQVFFNVYTCSTWGSASSLLFRQNGCLCIPEFPLFFVLKCVMVVTVYVPSQFSVSSSCAVLARLICFLFYWLNTLIYSFYDSPVCVSMHGLLQSVWNILYASQCSFRLYCLDDVQFLMYVAYCRVLCFFNILLLLLALYIEVTIFWILYVFVSQWSSFTKSAWVSLAIFLSSFGLSISYCDNDIDFIVVNMI